MLIPEFHVLLGIYNFLFVYNMDGGYCSILLSSSCLYIKRKKKITPDLNYKQRKKMHVSGLNLDQIHVLFCLYLSPKRVISLS
jgi:hypothetical protein